MAELVTDCPRCGSKHITFDVLSDTLIGRGPNDWQPVYEAFGTCRRCKRSTIFRLMVDEYAFAETRPSQMKSASIDYAFKVQGFVSVADLGAEAAPEHLPADLLAVYDEASKCLAISCPNAAATMFRMCLDAATRAFLPPEGDAGGPNAKQRRDLGLRLPWLFANGKLPLDLQELATCIREDGNDGAHAGTLSMHDAEDVRDFTFRLLDRLYAEPERIKLAAARRAARRAPPPP